MYYFVGYTSNNDWSTSVITMDQYQEKLQKRILSDFNKLELSKKIQLLKDESLVNVRDKELQRVTREKEQLLENHHQLLDREQQLQTNQATLALQLQEANTLLQQAEKSKEALHHELKEERQLSSSLMKQKGKQVTASEENEIIELLKTKLDDEKKEEKKLREELQEEIESLQQQLQQVKDHKEVGVQFDYLIPQSGMCMCVYMVVDMMRLSCFRFDRLECHYSWTEALSSTRRQVSLITLEEIWIQIMLS